MRAFALALVALGLVGAACSSSKSSTPYLNAFKTVTQVASTVPPNGDVNPYGLAVVPDSAGKLVAGDTLVSNFNDRANVQGTGTTLVEVSPTGTTTLFADLAGTPGCPGGIGLTTALGILPGGWVVVGSLPAATGGALPSLNPVGCLLVVDSSGKVAETITNSNIVGPWDLAVTSTATTASVFVSNALGGNTTTKNGVPATGNCTVVRVDLALQQGAAPSVTGTTVIGTGFPWVADPTAFVLAPTGLALAKNGTLFVDDTQTNAVYAIPQAATRTSPVTAASSSIDTGGGLNQPLGMALAPNGDLIVVNGGDGNVVEVTPAGKQVAVKTLVANGAGDLFGVLAGPGGLVLVNDGQNAVDVYR